MIGSTQYCTEMNGTLVVVVWMVVIATISVCTQGHVLKTVNHQQLGVRRAPHRVSHPYNATHKLNHSSLHNSSTSHRHKKVVRKKSTWNVIMKSLTQMILGADDDYDSSEYDSSEASESSEHTTHPSRPNWRGMASSALAQVGLGLLSKLWKRTKNKKKRSGNQLRQPFSITTSIPMVEEGGGIAEKAVAGAATKKKVTEEEGKVVAEGIQGVEEREPKVVTIEDQIYKLAGKQNSLRSLAELKQEVEDSGRRLSFIEYAAILEIVVLAVIAAGVFRTASFPVPVPVFAKA
uniref:Uncharacterized protein n=1 Tax=Homalodisca liturata TaxID=320908 RepID=A0A1B6JJ75_9HEMI